MSKRKQTEETPQNFEGPEVISKRKSAIAAVDVSGAGSQIIEKPTKKPTGGRGNRFRGRGRETFKR